MRVADLPVLTSRDRRALRSHVLAQLLEFDEQIATLTRSFDDIVEAAVQSNVDDEHDPEGTTIAFERQQVAALLRQAKADREALLLARDRIEQPGYGVCEYCKGFIGIERLLALPYAARWSCASARSTRTRRARRAASPAPAESAQRECLSTRSLAACTTTRCWWSDASGAS